MNYKYLSLKKTGIILIITILTATIMIIMRDFNFQKIGELAFWGDNKNNEKKLENSKNKDKFYVELEKLLEAKEFKKADVETLNVMLKVSGREKEGILRIEDINNFPCKDLQAIDKLWLKYSNQRFSFSIQNAIYEELGGTREYNHDTWAVFGKKTGWWQENYWLDYHTSSFDINQPFGHLPGQVTFEGSEWRGGYLFHRVKTCNFNSALNFDKTQLFQKNNIDYTNLESLLATKQFGKADEETWDIMLQLAERKEEGNLRVKDIYNLPCKDLRTIENLWLTHSDRRFGFSIQRQIYQELGQTRGYKEKIWKSFGDKIGWRRNGNWLSQNQLNLETNAKNMNILPVGHFPQRPGHLNWHWDIYPRIEACEI